MRLIGPKGKFLLEPKDRRTHLFVSTGTGIAPFISMIRQTMIDRDPRRTVVLNGCSFVDELGYRDALEGWASSGTYPLTYVPTISRRTTRATPAGRGEPGGRRRSCWTSAAPCTSGRRTRWSTSAATRR